MQLIHILLMSKILALKKVEAIIKKGLKENGREEGR
jgi:hypothetical protein